MKVLFIMSRLLGGKTFSSGVVSIMQELQDIQPFYLFFDAEDWGKYPIPFINRKFNRFIPAHTARAKFNKNFSNKKFNFDCIFIQSFELILGFRDLIAKYPTILAHDSTDVLGHWLVYNQYRGKLNCLKYHLKNLLTIPCYKPIVKNVNIFMPRTKWCATSLTTDYDVPSEKVIVSPGYLDLNLWNPKKYRNDCASLKLLFVGNDFKRKGGYFLLDLYTTYLKEKFELNIVSNDTCLDNLRLPQGVKLFHGMSHSDQDELINIYRSSHIFVYPTRKDQLGLVLLEATATGLPIIATNVGGISDLVSNGINGFLMPYSASKEQWAAKLIELSQNNNKMLAFGKASREMAIKQFSKKVFQKKIMCAIEEVQDL